ncbi:uncharacterized protein M6B38_306080 [Iris pallida]|uniref:Uncharacterized protein n=1 Tax=Iris pallida TaxID=29817 RepID=A0AAX6HK64_IRIPA|nr:uncharacterized protein M6B38_306080 [Iris pallida]
MGEKREKTKGGERTVRGETRAKERKAHLRSAEEVLKRGLRSSVTRRRRNRWWQIHSREAGWHCRRRGRCDRQLRGTGWMFTRARRWGGDVSRPRLWRGGARGRHGSLDGREDVGERGPMVRALASRGCGGTHDRP